MKRFVTLLAIVSCFTSYAQENTPSFTARISTAASTISTFSVSGIDTSYSNSFTLTPAVAFIHKSGIGIQYAASASIIEKPVIYLHELSAFYEQYEKGNFNTNLSYHHFFFADLTHVPYSPISNEVYGYIAYKKWWISPVFSSDFGFGKDKNNNMASDWAATAGITHSFIREGGAIITDMEIAPSVFINGGTTRYFSFLQNVKYISHSKKFQHYLKGQSKKSKGNGSSNPSAATTGTVVNQQNFHLSNIEANLYSSFSFNQFKIVPTASIFIPTAKNSDGISGYWQLQLLYEF